MTEEKWMPLQRAEYRPMSENQIEALARQAGISVEEVREKLKYEEENTRVYLNNKYQVSVEDANIPSIDGLDWPEMLHLSIKRRDREPIHDWRDLQRIKNQLVGRECEGVELYPKESRRVDTTNQYHIYVFKSKDIVLPFGFFQGRTVTGPEKTEGTGAKQRVLDED